MYALTKENGERVRVDWKGEEPPSNMHVGRPAAAPLGSESECAELDLLHDTLSGSGDLERLPGPKRALLVRTRDKPPRHDVAISKFADYLPTQDHSWYRKTCEQRYLSVRNVMATTRCAVAVFKRVYCIPLQASSMDRGRYGGGSCCMNGSSFSPSQRASCVSLRELKREAWEPIANENFLATNYKKTQPPSPKADDHKILSLLILWSYEMVLPVRKTTFVFAARCEVSSICPSPSLPSSVSRNRFGCGDVSLASPRPRNSPSRHSFQSSACCVQRKPSTFDGPMCKFWMHPCQRVRKESDACSGIVLKSDVHQNESSTLNHILVQQFVFLLHQAPAPQESKRLFPLQNGPTETPATNPFIHLVDTERVEEFTPFRAVASSNRALPTPSRLSEHHPLLLSDVTQKT